MISVARDSRLAVLPSGPPLVRESAHASTAWWRLGDSLVAIATLTFVVLLSNINGIPNDVAEVLAFSVTLKNVALIVVFGLVWQWVFSIMDLYTPARLRNGRGELRPLVQACLIGSTAALAFPLTQQSGAVEARQILLFAVLIIPLAHIFRTVARRIRRVGRSESVRQVIIVGSGPLAARLNNELRVDASGRSAVIGFVDSTPHDALVGSGLPYLGDLGDLDRILMHRVVDAVLIGLPIKSRFTEIQHALGVCARVGVPARYPADLFGPRLGLSLPDGEMITPVLSLEVAPYDYRLVLKRFLDASVAGVLLILMTPILLAIAIAIKSTSPGPVLFAQERFGYMKRRFRMWKFRSMVSDAEELQATLEDRNEASGPVFKIRADPRLTSIGSFLRRSSLDELPQLWNVLIGEMSLVGPRPMSVRDVSRFSESWLMRRFSVRPGLTCLWQISGRSSLSFEEWMALDQEYIENWSLALDSLILVRTIPAVLRGSGAV